MPGRKRTKQMSHRTDGLFPRHEGMCMRLLFSILFSLCLFPAPGFGQICAPLPQPTGNIVNVATPAELVSAVNSAAPGDAILLADGTYNLNGEYLWIDTDNLSIRSQSGNREAVIVDGNYATTEIFTVAASNVTITDLTIQRAYTHPIHVAPPPDRDIVNTRIHNIHIVDPGEQAIKINANNGRFADYGEISCCRIELTDAGRPYIRNDCYTGGVDAHQARGWVIRDNHIEGFWCENGLSEHAVHAWTGSRDTIVERNVLVDNSRGVGFGLLRSGSGRTYDDNPCPGEGYVDHYGGIIRNNFIFQSRQELLASQYGFESGIALWQACGALILHNTVVSTARPFSSIEHRFENTDATITNNLLSHSLMERDGATAVLAGNLEYQPLTLFVSSAEGNLHLKSGATVAIDKGVFIGGGLCPGDIDGDSRDPTPDVGADEMKTGPANTAFPWLPVLLLQE